MAKQQTFNNITPAIWECVKATSLKDHGTVYAPEGAAKGTASTSTPVGEVVLSFDYDEKGNTVTYDITKKPWIVGTSTIWEGIQSTIDGCSK